MPCICRFISIIKWLDRQKTNGDLKEKEQQSSSSAEKAEIAFFAYYYCYYCYCKHKQHHSTKNKQAKTEKKATFFLCVLIVFAGFSLDDTSTTFGSRESRYKQSEREKEWVHQQS